MRRAPLVLFALAWLLASAVPYGFMIVTGFKDRFELLTRPIWTLPRSPTLDNFKAALTPAMGRLYGNSLLVVSLSVVLVLAVGAMAAYAFARLEVPLRRPLFALIVAGLVVPTHVVLIPVYLFMTSTGLYDTTLALVGPYVASNLPVTVFVLTEFMRQIPRDLEDAARIDGCGPVRRFFAVMLPLTAPALATMAVFNAIAFWNEFVFAFVLTSSPARRTLPLGIWEFQGQYGANVPVIMAALSLASLPLVLVYLVAQERVTSGMMAGAVKG